MKDLPLIFSPAMVLRLKAGQKTQTRRIEREGAKRIPYKPGDIFWVRETLRGEELPTGLDGVRYRADDAFSAIEKSATAADAWLELHTYRGHEGSPIGPWVPPIHVPKWTSRLSLIVESVKRERLQDISEADAIAEGMLRDDTPGSESFGAWSGGVDFIYGSSARGAFRRTWELLHGPESWAANPWVIAPSFRVIEANIHTIDRDGRPIDGASAHVERAKAV